MLDAMRTDGDELPAARLSQAEIAHIARELDLAPTPENALALTWALGRGEIGMADVGDA